MKLRKLTISGFRCFGSTPVTVDLTDAVALVGANGSGKSTVLLALCRLFGTNPAERTMIRDDFHVPPGRSFADYPELNAAIEVEIIFPELSAGGTGADGVPECFSQMLVDGPGTPPYCRARLEATWTRTNLADGQVDARLDWIRSPGAIDAKTVRASVRPQDRSRIHVHYVPASRDPGRQLRQLSGAILPRLLRAIRWSDEARGKIEDAAVEVRTAMANSGGLLTIERAITSAWAALRGSDAYRNVLIRPAGRELSAILRNVEVLLEPAPGGAEHLVERLSEGLQSLFYFSIVAAAFGVDAEIVANPSHEYLAAEELDPPALTVFAVEEPENHLSPHYLGRIMDVLGGLASTTRGQVVISSHSASILSRVEPGDVRHLIAEATSGTSSIRPLPLPAAHDDVAKFVRQAVRSYPELYFAKLVVLGEGDSEAVVLPRLAGAYGLHIDRSFVSLAPLGGRHVNHFWRLLNGLGIPHLTLLDLDIGRQGGGWHRIAYALQELLNVGWDPAVILGSPPVNLAAMSNWSLDAAGLKAMASWVSRLESLGVFFSNRLDLDFLMLTAYPTAYKAVAAGAPGPFIPSRTAPDWANRVASVEDAVLKDARVPSEAYGPEQLELFFWYRYLFLGRGKPTTHALALASLDDSALRQSVPPVLGRLIARMIATLAPPPPPPKPSTHVS